MRKRNLIGLLLLGSILGGNVLASCGTTNPSTPTSTITSVDPASRQAVVNEANEYIGALNLNDYREAERSQLQEAIDIVNALIADQSKGAGAISAALAALQELVPTLKTDAEYRAEEDARLQDAITKKLKGLPKLSNNYRQEEKAPLAAALSKAEQEIRSLTSVDAVRAYDLSEVKDLFESAKTNADYVTEEMGKYPLESPCGLIGPWTAGWKFGTGEIEANNIGYVMDRTEYDTNGLVLEFSVACKKTWNICGFMIGNFNKVYDGFDGYLVSIYCDQGYNFVQIYELFNVYGSDSTGMICEYMGGWVYPGSINGTPIRVEINDNKLKTFDQGSDINGGETIDLTKGKKGKLEVPEKCHVGAIHWDTDNKNVFDIKLTQLYSKNVVSGVDQMKGIINEYASTIDYSVFSEEVANDIKAKIQTTLSENTTYDELQAGLDELQAYVRNCPTKDAPKAYALAGEIMSADNSIRSTDSTLSGNVNHWTHTEGTGSIVAKKDENAWSLSKTTYSDFDLSFNIKENTTLNPYDGHVDSGIALWSNIDSKNPEKFEGIIMTTFGTSDMAFIEFSYLLDSSTGECEFITAISGDFAGMNMRLLSKDGYFSVYADGVLQTNWLTGTYDKIKFGALYNSTGSIGVYDMGVGNTYNFRGFIA